MRPLYIRVSEIPRGGLDVVAGRGKTWIPKALEGMNPHPLRSCRLSSAALFLEMSGRDLEVTGSFLAEGEGECDRCAAPVAVRLEKEFRTILIPRARDRSEAGEIELGSRDLEVAFYDGAGIEVEDVFWEQVALALPVKVLCREECRGVCPRCGGDRNRDECPCGPEERDSPFAVLKNLKST